MSMDSHHAGLSVDPLSSQSQEFPPLCRHFGQCGGCSTQDIPYPLQLKQKEEHLRSLLDPFPIQNFQPILASPESFFYRNKLELSFGGSMGNLFLGLKAKNRFDTVINLNECLLLSEESIPLAQEIRHWAQKEKLAPYNPRDHTGLLRFVIIREGKNTGERMVVLVTSHPDFNHESFLHTLKNSNIKITSAVLAVQDTRSDTSFGKPIKNLIGPGWIQEKIGPLMVKVTPFGFLQTNTHGAEILYQTISGWIKNSAGTLLDVYCGAGTIGLYILLQKKARRILGIDQIEESVRAAQVNKHLNNVKNADFLCARAEQILEFPLRKKPDVVIVDPPRAGLHPRVLRKICENPPPQLIYISCNPDMLIRDLTSLSKIYHIREIQPIDLFPHTPHIETACHLDLKLRDMPWHSPTP